MKYQERASECVPQRAHRSRGSAPCPAHLLRDTRSELVHTKTKTKSKIAAKINTGAHHPAAHIILRLTSSPLIILRSTSSWRSTSSCSAHHPGAHMILWLTSSCSAHHPGTHIGAHRLAAHIVLQRTHPAAHVLRRTLSCGAHHREAHIILGRTSAE
ncbi:unnamed protein product [Pleuronectes platessa]|uniref:Uncharacterized protein n=1 Tax=Pleuronectes platessa TaxID=8262 RepID=A0A9N7UM16_PLEPL|nr:unnamed protein product [Pleuronectes platessa]